MLNPKTRLNQLRYLVGKVRVDDRGKEAVFRRSSLATATLGILEDVLKVAIMACRGLVSGGVGLKR